MGDNDPAAKPKRRRFGAAYKLAVLDEYERLTDPGAKGALLRREGLYSSHIVEWRRAREVGASKELAPKARPAKRSPEQVELDRAKKRAERLKNDLATHKLALEIQGEHRSSGGCDGEPSDGEPADRDYALAGGVAAVVGWAIGTALVSQKPEFHAHRHQRLRLGLRARACGRADRRADALDRRQLGHVVQQGAGHNDQVEGAPKPCGIVRRRGATRREGHGTEGRVEHACIWRSA